ncbi:hypothetical protein [Methylobacterium bullatum]|uniref:Uncharacterized protein n=1 Tax=Methylobacterium bullatum TaxID=570505 RepID=A0AAV4Z1T7_9HYPH|nr:hypothetical protein [Methylobacterium bullatum]MBD8904175.1 hypothetical protein [Methylobacterium bullatum]GJD37737.1 hypothetical protein OICFNHDK_0175 [Methylobacterium bullatum]
MSTARKIASGDQTPNLRQRAETSRQSVTSILEASPRIAPRLEICAAGRLGEMLAKVWDLRDKLDDETTPENRAILQPMEDYYFRKIDDLETAISFARATSPAGMLAQLAVAASAVDLASNGSNHAICSAAGEQAERCLFSVTAALCTMFGLDRVRFGASRYLSENCDQLAVLAPEVA